MILTFLADVVTFTVQDIWREAFDSANQAARAAHLVQPGMRVSGLWSQTGERMKPSASSERPGLPAWFPERKADQGVREATSRSPQCSERLSAGGLQGVRAAGGAQPRPPAAGRRAHQDAARRLRDGGVPTVLGCPGRHLRSCSLPQTHCLQAPAPTHRSGCLGLQGRAQPHLPPQALAPQTRAPAQECRPGCIMLQGQSLRQLLPEENAFQMPVSLQMPRLGGPVLRGATRRQLLRQERAPAHAPRKQASAHARRCAWRLTMQAAAQPHLLRPGQAPQTLRARTRARRLPCPLTRGKAPLHLLPEFAAAVHAAHAPCLA